MSKKKKTYECNDNEFYKWYVKPLKKGDKKLKEFYGKKKER